MVLDHVAYAGLYAGLSPDLRRALDHLASTNWSDVPIGRHAIDGDALVAIVSDYETQSADRVPWEAHRRYIDVQYIHRGVERIGHAPLESLVVGTYDAERDLVTATGSGTFVTLTPGTFAILWPHDAHRPGVWVDGPAQVRKIVLKVATAMGLRAG